MPILQRDGKDEGGGDNTVRISTPEIGIQGIPFRVNTDVDHPLVVVESCDRCNRAAASAALAAALGYGYRTWRSGADPVMHELLSSYIHMEWPERVQILCNLMRVQTQYVLNVVTGAVVLDRWWPTALVYGKALGLDESGCLSDSRHLVVPDIVIVLDKADPVGTITSAYDHEGWFRERVRELYKSWLPRWWRTNVPTSPIGVYDVSGLSDYDHIQARLTRTARNLLKQAGL